MGESKRRTDKMNKLKKNKSTFFSQIVFPKNKADLLFKWTTNAAWIGIGISIFIWFAVHFIGPTFGWWILK